MLLCPRCSSIFNSAKNFAVMTSKQFHLFESSSFLVHTLTPVGKKISPPTHHKLLFSSVSPKPISPISCSASPFSSISHAAIPRPVEQDAAISAKLTILKKKLETVGINGDSCTPGQHYNLLCPKCEGGSSLEKSLSLFIMEDGSAALWNCFRANCGWKGISQALANSKSTYGKLSKITKPKQQYRQITEEDLQLEPLGNELLAYFAERMISAETLRRNAVMQRRSGSQIAIAFTYRRNGMLVSCKYRETPKRFWQNRVHQREHRA